MGSSRTKEVADEEVVYIVMIPRDRHGEVHVECIQAQQVELEKLKIFQTYKEVDGLRLKLGFHHMGVVEERR